MDDYKVDYHIHTTYSDGHSTPTDIIKKAKEQGYDIIAITDHDNVDGIPEAMIASETVGLKVIPGLEIAAETEEGIGLHILGYHIDHESEELNKFLKQLIANREDRNIRLFEALQEMGYDVSPEDIEKGKNSFIGKPLIADALVRKGYITNWKEAFGSAILKSEKIKKIRKAKPSTGDAIDIIMRAGGTAVLAHPIQIEGLGAKGSEEFYAKVDKLIGRLKRQGLKGLECFHPEQNEEESQRFIEIAEKYHLHITRGSDFHGDDYMHVDKWSNGRRTDNT